MAILNFKEIPEAHIATREQDKFELFAREFLEYLGYKTESGPDRGADKGKDIFQRLTECHMCQCLRKVMYEKVFLNMGIFWHYGKNCLIT